MRGSTRSGEFDKIIESIPVQMEHNLQIGMHEEFAVGFVALHGPALGLTGVS